MTSRRTINTLIFDIDDTLYPVSSGFSDHRNGDVIAGFLVDELGFATKQEALAVRDEVFRVHHSTLKGLVVASSQGKLPRPFKQEALGEYWAQHCDFRRFLEPNKALATQLKSLRDDAGMKLVVFTNAPRLYGVRCLEALGIRDFFQDSHVFGVEDVLPACKPEAAAFEIVLAAVGSVAEEAVMFEDSLKNIRACRALGIRTVLVDERSGDATIDAQSGEAALLDDVRVVGDDVDATIQRIEQLGEKIPQLWSGDI